MIFFYRNINIPKEKINVVQKLKDIGYVYDEVDGISRFYKEDLLELEFLTRVLGAGTEGRMDIKHIGITSEGLRVINILSNFAREIEVTGTDGEIYTITVPEPAVFAIQKILTNPTRKPPEKNKKKSNMPCPNVKECMCPKTTCTNYGKCCDCVIKHRTTDSLPYCLFPDNGGDKSNRNHYEVLKKRFEGNNEN